MLEFNNTNIFTGFLKEKLNSFNLPNCAVYDKATFNNGEVLKENSFCIVKNYEVGRDYIVYKDTNKKLTSMVYAYGKRYKNITITLEDYTKEYNTKTHEYLGQYLRFIRDYKGLDLMSMYNCYSQRILSDNTYDYVIIPMGKNRVTDFTISCNKPFVYTMLTANNNSDLLTNIQDIYKQKDSSTGEMTKAQTVLNRDLKKFIYTINIGSLNYQSIQDWLVLRFIKNTEFRLTVLEGTYKDLDKLQFNFKENYNDISLNSFIHNNQLLNYPTTNLKSYPFADKLEAYLLEHPITNQDKYYKDIVVNVKNKLEFNTNPTDDFDNNTRIRVIDKFNKTKINHTVYDINGYSDKDTEEILDSLEAIKKENK